MAAVPLLVTAALLIWQLIVLSHGALRGYERARADALAARGSGIVHLGRSTSVPSVVPGVGALRVPVRVAVRAP